MRYLITGGAGFIGSHLSEALLERGAVVFVLDDLSTGSVENIRHLKTNGRFHYAFDSIQNKHLLAELVDESDIVIHLAAAVGVRLIVEHPVHTLETNIHGTQSVLDAASKKRSWYSSPQPLKFTARATKYPSRKMRTSSWVRPQKHAGAMRRRRPSMNFLRWRIGKKDNSP